MTITTQIKTGNMLAAYNLKSKLKCRNHMKTNNEKNQKKRTNEALI